jgi:hypothetical protein
MSERHTWTREGTVVLEDVEGRMSSTSAYVVPQGTDTSDEDRDDWRYTTDVYDWIEGLGLEGKRVRITIEAITEGSE